MGFFQGGNSIHDLLAQERVFADRFAESGAPLRERDGVREGTLHQADTANGVADARAVQHFEDVVNAVFRIAE